MNNADYQEYFKRRMVELMNRYTLDSYRVRTNNTMSILSELINVLSAWIKGDVKRFETVAYCIEECQNLINDDVVIRYHYVSKKLFLDVLSSYLDSCKNKDIPNVQETQKLIYWVEDLYDNNKDEYLSGLLNAIKKKVTTEEEDEGEMIPNIDSFDSLLRSYAVELLRYGYSKGYLYKFFSTMKKNAMQISFEDAFNSMYTRFCSRSHRLYTVVMKLNFSKRNMAEAASGQIEQIVDRLPDGIAKTENLSKSFSSPNDNVRFFTIDVEAFDSHGAAIKADEELQMLLDTQQELVKGATPYSYALVFIDDNGTYKMTREKLFVLDSGGDFMRRQAGLLHEMVDTIYKSTTIEADVKDRLSSALRHLRLGDSQMNVEQQFINYWIGLEFIFSSSSRDENTYQRIKSNLVNILTTCYVKRNMLQLKYWIVKKHAMGEDDNIFEKIDDSAFCNSLPNILMRYRASKMKSHLRQRESIRNYMKQHESNLRQHLSRIYRLRNELVHEAAIKQDIVNVTSNLRFYLMFVINQMIGYFSDNDGKHKTMMRFFWQYEKNLYMIHQANDRASMINSLQAVKMYDCLLW